MLKELYEIFRPLGLGATLGSLFILVGVLLLPGMDYDDLKRFTSTAAPYAESIIFVISGAGIFLVTLWTLSKKARNLDEVKQEYEELKREAKKSELRTEEIKLQIKRKFEDVRDRSHYAREHLRLFQRYLSLLAEVRRKKKVESSDIVNAKEVCKTVADHWDEADRSGIFYDFYEVSHRMFGIRWKLVGGLERLIGNDRDEVEGFCDRLYQRIKGLETDMRENLMSIEDTLFLDTLYSPDFLSFPGSGQSPR